MEDTAPTSTISSSVWPKVILVVFGIVLVSVALGLFVFRGPSENINDDVPVVVEGSDEFTEYQKSIRETRERLEEQKVTRLAQGDDESVIALEQHEEVSFLATTLVMKVALESQEMSDSEKEGIVKQLEELTKEYSSKVDLGACRQVEEELPLQDFFTGSTLVFEKPMIYIDWPSEQARDCAPTLVLADHLLDSVEGWDSIIFDKSEIIEHPIATGTTFTVEKRVKITTAGLFEEEREHYVLRDSNGTVSTPSFLVFDADYLGDSGDSGSKVYRNGEYVGHVIFDVQTGVVWIEENGVPGEVIEANTPPPPPTSFETPRARRGELVKRIRAGARDETLVDFTNAEIIEQGLIEGLYEHDGSIVTNSFGGEVELSKQGESVSLVYTLIPSEECYEFYYINDPSMYGFKESYINGVLEEYPAEEGKTFAQLIKEFGETQCYVAGEFATIEFRGEIGDISGERYGI